MKKLLAVMTVLLLLTACLAGTAGALQRDVRVYVEEDLSGLEDAQGNLLCEAKYDQIEMIDGYACAIIHKGGKKGVLGADGVEIAETVWDVAAVDCETGTIMCTNLPEGPAQVITMPRISEEPETGPDISQLEYAMQGDVRVYVENGLAGLEDARGNPLCEAKYSYIDAFLERDYAVCHLNGKKGVVSADGSEIIPPEWDGVVIDDEGRKALCMNYPEGPVAVVDLDTGEAYHREESLPTAYVSDRYAMQGNVRVYTRNGLVGIEDVQGNALCGAKYDYIEPFGDLDCAIVHSDGKCGVICRDGRETVGAQWDYILLSPDGRTALCQNYGFYDSTGCIVDAMTGEELYRPDAGVSLGMRYGQIIIQKNRPPYRADVYDSGMNILFSVNAKLDHYEQYYLAEFNDGTEGMLDLEGNVVVDGLSAIGYLRNGYAAYFRSEYAYANESEEMIDAIGNGLDRLLWKNSGRYRDRNCLEWVMYRFGVETQPRQEKKYLGVIHVSGERFEYDGAYQTGMMGDFPDEAIDVGGEGLYLVNVAGNWEDQAGGWTYFDAEGNQAVPGSYDSAYMFVDGSAIVRRDGAEYLIDRSGEIICTVCENVCWDRGNVIACEQPVVNVCYGTCDYHRAVNRQGEFINDVKYRSFKYDLNGYFTAEALGGGAMVFDINGNAMFEREWDLIDTSANNYTDGFWAWKDELLYHVDLTTGEPTSIHGYAERLDWAARLPGGDNWVCIDKAGNPVGPYYEQDDYF